MSVNTVSLISRCAEKGARFSVDASGGVLVGNHELLDVGDVDELRRRGNEIRSIVAAARQSGLRQLVASGDLAVLAACEIVRLYASESV